MATTFDTAKKSPSISVDGTGLVATGPSSGYGCVLSTDGVASGTGYFVITTTTVPSGATMWVGIATAAHDRRDNNNSWAGGDAESGGVYNNGGGWRGPSQFFGTDTFTSGDVVRIDINRTTGFWYITTNGHPYGTGIALPSGTIYAAVGLDHSASVATADFTGLVSGGGTILSVAGSAVGAGTAAGFDVLVRGLGGDAGGAGAASGACLMALGAFGTAGGSGVVSGGWASSGPLALIGAGQGTGFANAAGSFSGAIFGAWTQRPFTPATWATVASAPETWTRTSP